MDRYERAAIAIRRGLGGSDDFAHQADYLAHLALDAADLHDPNAALAAAMGEIGNAERRARPGLIAGRDL